MALTVGNVGGETAAERLQYLLNIKEEERGTRWRRSLKSG